MPQIFRLDGLQAKSEGASYGVDASPTTTDAVRIARRLGSQIELDYEWENLRDDAANGSILPVDPALPRGRRAKVTIDWEVKGAGSDVPPEAQPLYIGCGLPETDGTNTWDYGPVTSATKGSATLYCYAHGLLIKVIGARGHFTWPLVVGEVAVHRFVMFGIVATDPADASVPANSYDTNEPIAGVNTSLTIGSWTPSWISGELDLAGIDPALLKNGNATDGLGSFDFGSTDPTFRLVAQKDALATYDPMADRKAQTARTLAMTWGSTQYNRVKVLAAPLKTRRHEFSDNEGFSYWNLTYRVSSGGVIRFD